MTDTPKLLQDTDIRTVWRLDLEVVGCSRCGVAHLVPPDRSLLRCPVCLAESLESQPARLRSEPPELVLPFNSSLTRDNLSLRLNEWLRGVWLRPRDLCVESLLSRLDRVYLPVWLVDGKVIGSWSARMGFDYQVESTQERFSEDIGWTSRRLKETRTRWESRVGRITRTYHNLAVPALEENEEAMMRARVGRYQLEQAVAYSPATIANATVRVPSLLPKEAWPLGRAAFECSVIADCLRAAGAQHSDEFSLSAEHRDLNWTQLLLPLLITYYQDDAGRFAPVWINGQTGQIGGVKRASLHKAWRVTGSVGAVALLGYVVGVLLVLLNISGGASLVMTLSFFLTIVAALPVLWAWQFNQHRG